MARIEIKNRLNLYFLEGESWRVFNIIMKRVDLDLTLVSLMTTVAVTILFSLLDQTGWASVIYCPTSAICNGTNGDDVIIGTSSTYSLIHGLGGNDYIKGSANVPNYLFGDDGNDILIGRNTWDTLEGGRGNDRYDGGSGDDSILEASASGGFAGALVNNDDIISGGEGFDFINSGDGFDRIQGGPGNDIIYPNGYFRDFSYDSVDCGSGTGDKVDVFYSGDPDYAINCEYITDFDR